VYRPKNRSNTDATSSGFHALCEVLWKVYISSFHFRQFSPDAMTDDIFDFPIGARQDKPARICRQPLAPAREQAPLLEEDAQRVAPSLTTVSGQRAGYFCELKSLVSRLCASSRRWGRARAGRTAGVADCEANRGPPVHAGGFFITDPAPVCDVPNDDLCATSRGGAVRPGELPR
jgi:hypothetical protein